VDTLEVHYSTVKKEEEEEEEEEEICHNKQNRKHLR